MNSLPKRKIRVLVVDDSAIVRKLLSDAISAQSDMEVVGTAPDPYIARDKILALNPDVITLDIEMPRMDGITFLKKLMQHHPVPTIIISSVGHASCAAAIEALRCGAVDVLAKPAGPYSVGDLCLGLAAKVRAAAEVRLRPDRLAVFQVSQCTVPVHQPPVQRLLSDPAMVIALGASTGGISALQDVLPHLPADMPGMVVTQHIPAGFSGAFAARLNSLCAMDVREAVHGDVLRKGQILIAPGDHHLVLRSGLAGYVVELQQGPPVCYQRPSVDVMFASVAKAAGPHAVGVLLTGMGTDGAKGLLALKQAGATTIGQDEASCVVYGMPREAARMGAISIVASLADVARILTETVRQRGSARSKAI
jgi:two-component system chemotaxis response regulator CheB